MLGKVVSAKNYFSGAGTLAWVTQERMDYHEADSTTTYSEGRTSRRCEYLVCENNSKWSVFSDAVTYVTVSGKRYIPRKMYILVISDYRYRVQLRRIRKHT